MSQEENNNNRDDEHEHDMVMPGFRFHPTEEELVEFYLRRKVEGKRFNVELITFLDLYCYDPWELPALAAIGEKEWFFYVPRDRKYRNGDRPNRVTTSGYWKATGADRTIRGENSRPIGLKKTLVFYTGKAPRGIRTSWIMNEYRLPQHETERYQKVEISLCRVHKRAGVEDHPSVPRSSSFKPSPSSRPGPSNKTNKPYNIHVMERQLIQHGYSTTSPPNHDNSVEKNMTTAETDGSCSSSDVSVALGLSAGPYCQLAEGNTVISFLQPPPPHAIKASTTFTSASASVSSSSGCSLVPFSVDELHTIVNHQFYGHQAVESTPPLIISPGQMMNIGNSSKIHSGPVQVGTSFSDRLWDWNPVLEAGRPLQGDQFGSHFK